MEIEIPEEILELAEKEGYEVIDVRAPKESDEYVGVYIEKITTAISDHALSHVGYIVKKKEWVPEIGEKFYSVVGPDAYNVATRRYEQSSFIESGNYFKTAEQVRAASKALPEFFAKFRVEV